MNPSWLPHWNAACNATAFVLQVMGYLAIRRGDKTRHKKLMIAAVGVSALFLAGYLTYHYLKGHTTYAGPARTLYLSFLASHVILSMVVVPMILRVLWLAFRGELDRHRRLARITLPLWMYVGASGVGVYLWLYHLVPQG